MYGPTVLMMYPELNPKYGAFSHAAMVTVYVARLG